MWKKRRIELRACGTAKAIPNATTTSATRDDECAPEAALPFDALAHARAQIRLRRPVELAPELDECALELSHTTPSAVRARATFAT